MFLTIGIEVAAEEEAEGREGGTEGGREGSSRWKINAQPTLFLLCIAQPHRSVDCFLIYTYMYM